MALDSRMAATKWRRPPQSGHSSTSMSSPRHAGRSERDPSSHPYRPPARRIRPLPPIHLADPLRRCRMYPPRARGPWPGDQHGGPPCPVTIPVTLCRNGPSHPGKPGGQRWRRWESKTADFSADQATTGNHRKPDPDSPESKHEEKQFREIVLPSGKIEHETTQGRADVGETPTAETLGSLARKVLSSSRHAESRRLARSVLRLLRGSEPQS